MDEAASRAARPHGSDVRWRIAMLGLGLAVGGMAGGFVGAMFGALPAAKGPPRVLATRGRVAVPVGVSPAGLRITASRGTDVDGRCMTEADGTFTLPVWARGPFDLHVSDWETWRDPLPLDGSPPELSPTHAVEGLLRNVPWGAQGVVVEVASRPLAGATIRVRGPDGAPASGAWVRVESFGDSVRARADALGVAHLRGLPVRPWQALAWLADRPLEGLQTGWAEFVPANQELDLAIPQGVRVHVRLAAGLTATLLSGGGALGPAAEAWMQGPWSPAPDGTMTLLVAPGVPTLSLTATFKEQLDERTTRESTVAEGSIAVREDATLVLERIER